MSAHLNLKGLIEPAKEIEKLEKKKAALKATIDKLKKLNQVKGKSFFSTFFLEIIAALSLI